VLNGRDTGLSSIEEDRDGGARRDEKKVTSEGHLHDVDVQPVGALLHGARAVGAQLGKVGRQDRRCYYGLGSHGEAFWQVQWALGEKEDARTREKKLVKATIRNGADSVSAGSHSAVERGGGDVTACEWIRE
jgi:hypothetical protein